MQVTKVNWSVGTTSGGNIGLTLSYDGIATRQQKERMIADAIDKAHQHMERQGYIPAKAQLMSSSDLAKEYGYSRQYWEKLLKEEKITYRETGAGRITTNLWVNAYLKNRENVNRYVRNVKQVLRQAVTEGKITGKVPCPECLVGEIVYHTNSERMTAICRSCGFYINATVGEDKIDL